VKSRGYQLACALTMFLLASCGSGSARVEVVNTSHETVSNVQLIARGTQVFVGRLAPGESRAVSVCPDGESSLSVRFQSADGRQREAGADTYLECNAFYHLRVEIREDFSMTARDLN
jgi:hypothetical protein